MQSVGDIALQRKTMPNDFKTGNLCIPSQIYAKTKELGSKIDTNHTVGGSIDTVILRRLSIHYVTDQE